MVQLGWWFVVAVVPSIATAAGLGLCFLENRRPGPSLPEAAGPWLEALLRRSRSPVTVEVVPAEAPDAYWPNVGTIGISERTFAGTRPKDWAVAAHELGHAHNLAAHPWMPWLLPGTRLWSALGWRLCVAGLLAAALFGEPIAANVALVALITSVLATAVVCADEIAASRRALRWIGLDPRVSTEARGRSRDAMMTAAAAYVLGGVGQLLILGAWPVLVERVLGEVGLPRTPSDLGIWLVIAVTPVVALRAGLVSYQVLVPEPVPSELDLWAILAREAKWETVCAVGVLSMVLALHGAVTGPAVAVASAVAGSVALGPVVGLVAGLSMLPLVVARRVRGARPERIVYLRRARDDVPEAMLAMWANPPWYLRVAWLMPLAYLPLVSILAFHLAWF